MNFFQAQDRARRNTGFLVILFVLAVVSIITGIYAALHFFAGFASGEGLAPTTYSDPNAPLIKADLLLNVVLGVLAVISFGSIFKILVLSGGGSVVAESMGGKLILSSTSNATERQLLNITEEMSIAAGIPTPQVYLMRDSGINAFAAGTTLSNAVIGVTQGALETFTRDEMQGVIAHEFSHIINGDMRMNIRLTGIIHGIMLISYIGYFCLRASLYSSLGRSRSQGQAIIPIIGLVLTVIGFLGSFFGSWIRAIISRQREFLADASAVQFTRNPQGIAGALEKIGLSSGLLSSQHAAEYAHLFFSPGVSLGFSSPFASHPPLEKRIARIMPNWDGKTRISNPKQPSPSETVTSTPKNANVEKSMLASVAGFAAADVISQIGTINHDAIRCSADIQQQLPARINQALADSYSARALIYALLLGSEEHRQGQLSYLKNNADVGVFELTNALLSDVDALPSTARLPLVQRAIPTLRQLSPAQYQLFLGNMAAIIAADAAIDLFEWCVQAVVTHALLDCFGKAKRLSKASADDYAYTLSILARAGGAQEKVAFASAKAGLPYPLQYTQAAFEPKRLFDASARLAQLKPKAKAKFVNAAIRCVLQDDLIKPDEESLLRAYLMILDCPLPAQLTTSS